METDRLTRTEKPVCKWGVWYGRLLAKFLWDYGRGMLLIEVENIFVLWETGVRWLEVLWT